MIRLILVALYLFLFLVLSIPALLVLWVVGKRNPAGKDQASKAIVGWGFRCIAFIAGARVIARGTERIPENGAALFVGNHRSYFDIVLTYTLFPSITGYVAKKEMLRYPLLKDWMKNIHCLFLDRDNIKEGLKTILKGVEEVKNGISLCIFPEGTRNRENDTFLPFREGSFKIAEKGGVPIVPMVILNSADLFEDHLPRIKKATVIIEFQEPVYTDKMDRNEKKNLGGQISNLIKDRYFELKQEYMG
ncbi:MAG: 1-acyl-sn-glycerol-3-phosphate acyltransferase [Lachnospiraceae bacterium]|jgi:1-acyl-sn-glycerol-3-phosphate acyltransferase|nr:1-acyl-sn-glycerol-3-phosphate acyltransferase [Lachnospiraceae bacterium]